MSKTANQNNVAVTLPDGNTRRFLAGVTAGEVAAHIGPGLAKAALAARIDGKLVDLSSKIGSDAAVSIVTVKDDDALELLRHDAAHVLAEAAKELWPDIQVTIGPVIKDGFYYDFARSEPFTPDDLVNLEQRMHEIVSRDEAITREIWDREHAIDFFSSIGEQYKAEIVLDLPESEILTIYKQGEFVDLCRGPHLPSTGKLGSNFKLMKVAGAYWRGDSRNEMLQRIYGTAWATKKDLERYLHVLEEAERRDHRRLGPGMGLFHIQEEATGSVFWHAKGWTLYRVIESYMRRRLEAAGYIEVRTPQLFDRVLWEKSGHWEKFRDHMFTAESEERVLALKPMNCPGHVQIFRQGLKSYRDLPLRMAEFGSCHRNEPSGALHGLMRLRAFVQDDAHIFCTEDQVNQETASFCELLMSIYRDFGFDEVIVKFSDRPQMRAGDDGVWDRAERSLKDALDQTGLDYAVNPGEGAFYGPKLEFVLRDAIGREWQCGTLQVDFVLPERLDATYVSADGEKRQPVMLHRAILGSFERFIGILVEHYAGRFPLWIAPMQAVVATITNESDSYALEVNEALQSAGLRSEIDLRNETINYKVREHTHAKIPVILVVGAREAEQSTVSLRWLGGKDQEVLALAQAVAKLSDVGKAPA
ncbi:MAG: Threonine--tRNA ligase [Alphaproteobacteria bacterium MarineAlpha9_Bin7]|nr:MAG: Threonine--tRNA ligase [Alphaproteobacteria bacterium MarineAlpha9_Bin7]